MNKFITFLAALAFFALAALATPAVAEPGFGEPGYGRNYSHEYRGPPRLQHSFYPPQSYAMQRHGYQRVTRCWCPTGTYRVCRTFIVRF